MIKMINIKCPHCNLITESLIDLKQTKFVDKNGTYDYVIVEEKEICNACNRMFIIKLETTRNILP